MFYVQNPCALNKPWMLSKPGAETPISIPLEVTQLLKNYHIHAVEFIYRNYCRGMKGTILNEEVGMNYPLQVSAFFRAILTAPSIVLIICNPRTLSFWNYHLANHAKVDVVEISPNNSKNTFQCSNKSVALLLATDILKLCEDLLDTEFFSVVIEDFDQIAVKRIVKRLNGNFNIGLTCRSFYINPDPKLQWNMLNWANPGCVGKLSEFYEVDNQNLNLLEDNYRYWWLRLTWSFCESFQKPTEEEIEAYEQEVGVWASDNSANAAPKPVLRKRKSKSLKTESNEVPKGKYVKLPSMDENPIVTSIIKNFKNSPEPIPIRTFELPYTQTRPNCSKYDNDNVLLAFLEDRERPSTSKSESEQFILSLIEKSDGGDASDIKDVVQKADAVLQN